MRANVTMQCLAGQKMAKCSLAFVQSCSESRQNMPLQNYNKNGL